MNQELTVTSRSLEQGNFKLNECMRQIYEPLFKQYGVDIVFSGHSHAYERTYPMVRPTPLWAHICMHSPTVKSCVSA